ncbi:MAG: HU family DNA-binding protein [Planctomycetes bacterium]|nr:HU family DNA-binding protein [Planctomycetota bacterium]
MNKSELIDMVSKELGESRANAERAVNAVLDAVQAGVKRDTSCQINGFGTFTVRSRSARTGRNPKTGETMTIQASRTVGFRPASKFKEQV